MKYITGKYKTYINLNVAILLKKIPICKDCLLALKLFNDSLYCAIFKDCLPALKLFNHSLY